MSAATMDRRLAGDRAAMTLRGRSHIKPGSLLKDAIPIRTWAQWDDAVPGFVEIDLVGHEGGNAIGEHAYTLTVTDIATGRCRTRPVSGPSPRWRTSPRSCRSRCWGLTATTGANLWVWRVAGGNLTPPPLAPPPKNPPPPAEPPPGHAGGAAAQ